MMNAWQEFPYDCQRMPAAPLRRLARTNSEPSRQIAGFAPGQGRRGSVHALPRPHHPSQAPLARHQSWSASAGEPPATAFFGSYRRRGWMTDPSIASDGWNFDGRRWMRYPRWSRDDVTRARPSAKRGTGSGVDASADRVLGAYGAADPAAG